MAFWGIEVKPNRPYTLNCEDVNGRLILSQATLGISSSTKKCTLQCEVGDGNPVFLCTLLPDKIESCPLNLEFEEEEDVKFSVIGPTSIHLSGFIQGGGQGVDQDEDDELGEDIGETETESSDYDSEDAYEDDFIDDDDIDVFPPSPVRNSGVVIEEIVDDEKPAIEDGQTEQLNKTELSESENDKKSQHQIVPSGQKLPMTSQRKSTDTPMLESEDEDGFPVSSSHKSEDNSQKPQSEKEGNEPKRTSKKGKNKRKADTIGDEDLKSGSIQESSNATEVIADESIKEKKKKKKNQDKDGKVEHSVVGDKIHIIVEDKIQLEANSGVQTQSKHDPDSNNDNDTHVANGVVTEEKKSKKKKKKKGKNQNAEGVTNGEEAVAATSDKKISTTEGGVKKAKAKPPRVRTFPNGLVIEELEMGKPDGKRASPGKKVGVHYIGKLQKNDQIFDSNIGRAPFKFRLGVGAVIKGWDVGVEGMRIGDKRRLTIPPSMGYGARGAPPRIPPNSWLVFDVELADVS